MGKSREKRLWEKVSHLTEWTPSERRLLQAVCVIIAEATKRPTKAAKKEAPTLPFSPGDVHRRLLRDCGEWVNVETYSGSSFGRLGKVLQGVNDLEEADLDHLVNWINDGSIDWWTEPPTWDQVVKHIVNWIAKAREWAKENDYENQHTGSAIR